MVEHMTLQADLTRYNHNLPIKTKGATYLGYSSLNSNFLNSVLMHGLQLT